MYIPGLFFAPGLKWKGGMVEWWKGSPETSPSSYILCHPGQACLTRDPVFLKQPSDYETKHHIQYTVSSRPEACLLYTSDAADDLPCVDLGGRRIIKKKKTIIELKELTSTITKLQHHAIKLCPHQPAPAVSYTQHPMTSTSSI